MSDEIARLRVLVDSDSLAKLNERQDAAATSAAAMERATTGLGAAAKQAAKAYDDAGATTLSLAQRLVQTSTAATATGAGLQSVGTSAATAAAAQEKTSQATQALQSRTEAATAAWDRFTTAESKAQASAMASAAASAAEARAIEQTAAQAIAAAKAEEYLSGATRTRTVTTQKSAVTIADMAAKQALFAQEAQAAIAAARGTASAIGATGTAAAAAGGSIDRVLIGAASRAVTGFAAMSGASSTATTAMATGFGTALTGATSLARVLVPGGIMATAVTLITAKIIDLFVNARDEMAKTEKEFVERLDRMRQSADAEGLTREAFRIAQDISAKQAEIARLGDPSQNTMGQMAVSRTRIAAAQKDLALLQGKLEDVRKKIQDIPAQYAPTSLVFPVRVTTDSGEKVQKDAEDRAKKAADAFERAQRKAQDAADAVLAATVRRFEALGNSLDVQAQVLPLKQARELDAAVAKYGESSDAVRAIREAQSAEFAALNAKIAEQAAALERQRQAFDRRRNLVTPPPPDESTTAIIQRDRQPFIDAQNRMEAAAKAAQERALQISQAFWNSIQRAGADAIEGLLTRGLRSFSSFWDSVKQIALRALAEIATSQLMGRAASAFTAAAGNRTLASAAMPATTIMVPNRAPGSGPGIGIVNALGLSGSIGSGIIANPFATGMGSRLLYGATSMSGLGLAAGAGLLGNVLGERLGGVKGAGAGALAGAASGALIGSVVPVLGTAIGGIIGGAAGLIGGLFGGNKRREAARKAAEQAAAQAEAARTALEDLAIRDLVADGKDDEARRRKLLADQAKEREAWKVAYGEQSEAYQQLLRTQAKELAALTSSVNGDLASGTYLAPAGFRANAYRFDAGRPMAVDQSVAVTGPVTIVVPPGTTAEMAESIVRELQGRATAQGLQPTDWSQVTVQ